MLVAEYGAVSIRHLLEYIACLVVIGWMAPNKCLSRDTDGPTASRHGSMLLECHFVPYDFCTIKAKFKAPHGQREPNPNTSLIDAIQPIDFKLIGKNLFLEPGEYKADLAILDESSNNVAACPTILRVKAGRIAFQQPREEVPPLPLCLGPLKEGAVFALSSERIPFVVIDVSVSSGRLGITLNDDGSSLAESVAELAPTRGCWYDEPSCVAK